MIQPLDAATASALSPEEKRALLAELLRQRAAAPKMFPLSFAQERLWFLEQLEPGSAIYNMPAQLRARALEPLVLERCLNELVRRHESLRTVFVVQGERVFQQVSPDARAPFRFVDLRHLPTAARNEEARRLSREESTRPFDLANGPLLRALVVRVEDDDHVLALTMHHIISDGWSMGIVFRELLALYEAFLSGAPSPLLDLTLQYADFATWQRTQFAADGLPAQLGYWVKQLAGAPRLLELPTDRSRPKVQSFRGALEPFVVPAAVLAGLNELSRREGATLFMTLLASFDVMLHRYTGQTDIVVGSPIANRTRSELEGLIGLFVNTLVLRTDLGDEPTFRELLRRVREMTLEAYAHQDLPFEKLVEELQPERALSHNPLFQVMLIMQNAVTERLEGGPFGGGEAQGSNGTSKFDLTMSFEERKDGLVGVVEYSTDLFDAASIVRFIAGFKTLLAGIVEDADRSIGELPIITDAERRRLVYEWNATASPLLPERSIHELVEERVALAPHALAIIDGEGELTYAELDAQANQLARYLVSQGVEREDRVAVCMQRSARMIVALLAVLKAGAAYLPLDPAYPGARLAFTLEDAGAAIVLTDASARSRVPASARRVLSVDAESAEIGRESDARLPRDVRPGQLAYVIYTSGSTGRPKGVAIEHASTLAFIAWAREFFRPDELAYVLAATSICFDLSVFEIFVPLASGGAVVLAENVLALPTLPSKERVTLINSVPSAVAELVRARSIPPAVQTINLAGEALSRALVDQIYQSSAVRRVVNLYGPTEDTTYSTVATIDRDPGVPVTIGRPISNTQIYLLDRYGNPTPVGVPGELFIGGSGLARGYLGRPELTADRFMRQAKLPAARLYRTGDLARYLPDGQIDYLGRLDHQVKIRGFRIELGEIEAAIVRHPALTEAVVVASDDPVAGKRLVAYVVARSGLLPASGALRAHLEETLPDYMIPSRFVALSALPLTPNGKLDRRALPATEAAQPGAARVSPRSATERAIAGIWQQILQLPEVGVEDNFFELGGHSLLLTRVASRVRDTLGLELPFRVLFEHPTVASVSRFIDEQRGSPQQEALLPAVLVTPRAARMPLSFAQERMWFLEQLHVATAAYNISTALRWRGPIDIAAFERSVSEVVRRHEALRTTFAEEDGRPVQRIAEVMPIRVELTDLRAVPREGRDEDVQRRVFRASQQPFDLAAGPLLRVRLYLLEPMEQVVLVSMHHIVSDGWSVQLLFRELGALYAAHASGATATLPPPRVQYVDYVQWQKDWLRGDVLANHLAYWKERLAGAPEVLELPTDRPRPPVPSFRGAIVRLALERPLCAALRELSRAEGATLFMTLLAAYETLLHRHSGQEDIVIGTPIANRTRAELEGVIGLFVNTLALRTSLAGDPTFRELLGRVRETTLGAYAHQDLPFDKVVEELRPERNLSFSPVFQVMFGMQSADARGGATNVLEPFDGIRQTTAKLDLLVAVTEAGEDLEIELEYSADLFDGDTIARWADHFRVLLGSIVKEPEARLSELSLLTDAERTTLLRYNQTEMAFDRQATIHGRFQAQVQRSPSAIALVCERERLTYAELNARANRLCYQLIALGVGPGTAVALGMDRTSDLVVAIFAVLKAGGAYVPLDPNHPIERNRLACEDAGAKVLLTHAQTSARFADCEARVLCVDIERSAIAAQPDVDPDPRATALDLAYVIYTSGSSGAPKGVAVQHRSAVHLAEAMQAVLYARFSASWPLQASLNAPFMFDGSVERLALLARGHTLHLFSEELRHDAHRTVEYVRQERVDSLDFTPSQLKVLIDAGLLDPGYFVPKMLSIGGEPVDARLWALLRQQPATRSFNVYGPTECTVNATAACIDESGIAPTIGRALPNTRVYVLDRRMQLLPIGIPGEIYIGGEGLARGYLNQPELTRARFVTDPFSVEPGARLYQTGDLGRFRPDGTLEFLGRSDKQVKVRGFRIELGEIEEALLAHEALSNAAVLALPDARGALRLVAYVVARPPVLADSGPEESGAAAPSAGQLRRYLALRLPDHMVPSVFVALEALPLTVAGKLDRNALPPPAYQAPAEGAPFVAPRTVTEEALAQLWIEVLSVERVGVEDNFFELGGYSLLVMKLLSRVREVFQLEVTPRQVFEAPTLGEQANAIDRAASAGAMGKPEIPRLERVTQASPADIDGLSEAELDRLLQGMREKAAP